MIECVARVCKNYEDETLWVSIYLNGKKDIELPSFEYEKLIENKKCGIVYTQ